MRPIRTRAAIVLSTVAFLLAGVGAPSPAAAEDNDPTTWQVQPADADGPTDQPYFVLDAAPGATLAQTVAITNLSEHEISLRVFGSDARNATSGEFDLLPSAEQPQDIGTWISLDGETVAPDGSVTVPARSRLLVPFTITIPADATPGDHVGGIVTSMTAVRTTETGEQVLVDARVAARVYLAVSGDLEPVLQVGNVRAEHTGDWWRPWDDTVVVTWTVTNNGNLRLTGGQQVHVTGPFGWDLGAAATVQLPELLPGSSVEQSATVSGVVAAGLLWVDGALQPVDQTGRISEPLTPRTFGGTVLDIPWVLVVVVLVLLVVGWWLVSRRRRRRAADRALRAELTALQEEKKKAGRPDEPGDAPDAEPVRGAGPAT